MPVWLDDDFPTHPKIIAVGPTAAWLYVAGLAYASKHLTRGRIPKAVVPSLIVISRSQSHRIASKLCAHNLWHEDADAYHIHDYERYNAKQLAKREQARQAAFSRWAKQNGRTPGAHASACPDDDADALPRTRTRTRTDSSSSSVHTHERRPQAVDDEDDERIALAKQLADRDLERRTAAIGPPDYVEGWMLKAVARHLDKPLDQMRAELGPPPKDPRLAAALDPDNIAACPYCDEHGWLWRGDIIHGRCTHNRVLSDLTVQDIIGTGSST